MKSLVRPVCVLAAAACLQVVTAHGAPAVRVADASCVVADPTSTPLNYRTAPNGKVIGNLENGLRVGIIDRTIDDNGKPWAYIADADGNPIGWVFRAYVNCR